MLRLTQVDEQRERNRRRMAQQRSERDSGPLEEREAFSARARENHARYRERHRYHLRIREVQRRNCFLRHYFTKFGAEAFAQYVAAKRQRRTRDRERIMSRMRAEGVNEVLPEDDPREYEILCPANQRRKRHVN
ncbi:unnamed protein product [Mycena citricolor]|uniref:Uncharacterized protein n=1 Tax=Mycena citricolor TaxID=2018698 RepID=A0AAD2Q534_9AGAR|nr:unnamed protein product [Mycena citricolor]